MEGRRQLQVSSHGIIIMEGRRQLQVSSHGIINMEGRLQLPVSRNGIIIGNRSNDRVVGSHMQRWFIVLFKICCPASSPEVDGVRPEMHSVLSG